MRWNRSPRLRRLNSRGNVAIETALLFPVFFIFIGSIFDISMFTYSRLRAETIVNDFGRKAITGKTPLHGVYFDPDRQRQLHYLLHQELRKSLFQSADCQVSSQVFGRIGEINTAADLEDNTNLFGQSGDIVRVMATCRYIYFFPMPSFLQMGAERGTFRASTFVLNEPY